MIKLNNADISGSDFDDVNMSDTRYNDVNLSGSTFHYMTMKGSQFDDINLSVSKFSNIRMNGSHFEQVDLSDAEFSSACFYNASISASQLDGMTIDGIAVTELLACYRRHNP